MYIIEKTVTVNRNPVIVTMWIEGHFMRQTHQEPAEGEITLEDSQAIWEKTGRNVKQSELSDEITNKAFAMVDQSDCDKGDEYDRV